MLEYKLEHLEINWRQLVEHAPECQQPAAAVRLHLQVARGGRHGFEARACNTTCHELSAVILAKNPLKKLKTSRRAPLGSLAFPALIQEL